MYDRYVHSYRYKVDPPAGSPTGTLLRLLLPPNDEIWTRSPLASTASLRLPRPHPAILSVVATGGVYKEQGHNRQTLMTCCLLGIPSSRARISKLYPPLVVAGCIRLPTPYGAGSPKTRAELSSHRADATFCPDQCSARAAGNI